MARVKGYIVHAKEQTRSGRTEIHLFGRLEGGETFAVVERRWRPFFFVRAGGRGTRRGKLRKPKGRAPRSVEGDRRSLDGASLARVEMPSQGALQRLRDALHRVGIRTY